MADDPHAHQPAADHPLRRRAILYWPARSHDGYRVEMWAQPQHGESEWAYVGASPTVFISFNAAAANAMTAAKVCNGIVGWEPE